MTFAFLGCQQLVPFVIGRATDEGLIAGDTAALATWSVALLACICVVTAAGVASYVHMAYAGMDTDFRVQRYLVDTVVGGGSRLQGRVEAGELVAISTADARAFMVLSTQVGRLLASLLAFVLALSILATMSWWFVLAVGVGLPVMFACLQPLFERLESRGREVRTRVRKQIAISTDTVAGLRVICGIGGERHFLDRFDTASQATRHAGVQVGRTSAVLEFARLALPGALLVVILWLGAQMALSGSITAGEFVALFGYLAALTRPLQYSIQCINALTKANVASQRLHRLQRTTGVDIEPDAGETDWPVDAPLSDPVTGLSIEPGRITGIVTADGLGAADLLERLAGYDAEQPARIGSSSLDRHCLNTVRSHIHLMEARAQLFSGPLRHQLDVDGNRSDVDIMRAIHTASAVDVVGVDPSWLESETVPTEGFDLDIVVGERGRNFSGGERQRLILARALLFDPDILLLDDPASACDAQTEARIADRLARHRAGRTTAIATSSPQLLAICDRVVFVSERLVSGGHLELLEHDDYREAVSR